MKIDGRMVAVAFAVTLAFWAVAWAVSIDEIWRNVYDSSNTALRINQVSP